jgi:hypothetical protein
MFSKNSQISQRSFNANFGYPVIRCTCKYELLDWGQASGSDVFPDHAMKTYIGIIGITPFIFNLFILRAPAALPLGKNRGTHLIVGCVGPRVWMFWYEKIFYLCRDSSPGPPSP